LKISLFDDVVVSVSLGSTCSMVFQKENDEKIEQTLERGSAIVLSSEFRDQWTHAIPARKSDIDATGKRVQRGTRISITFRKVK